MRKLGKDDLYSLSEIADKMDASMPEIKSTGGLLTKKDQEQYGIDLAHGLFRKMYKAKKEIDALILDITGQTLEGKSPQEIVSLFKEILAQDGVLDFLKSAIK